MGFEKFLIILVVLPAYANAKAASIAMHRMMLGDIVWSKARLSNVKRSSYTQLFRVMTQWVTYVILVEKRNKLSSYSGLSTYSNLSSYSVSKESWETGPWPLLSVQGNVDMEGAHDLRHQYDVIMNIHEIMRSSTNEFTTAKSANLHTKTPFSACSTTELEEDNNLDQYFGL